MHLNGVFDENNDYSDEEIIYPKGDKMITEIQKPS